MHRDDGSVTAELAVGLIAVVLLLATLLGAVSLGQAQLRALDAAGAGARAAARGETGPTVQALAGRLAGPGAAVTVAPAGELVTVHVRLPVRLRLPGAPVVTVRGSASTPAEPQVGGP